MVVRRNPTLKEKIERTNWLPEHHNITGMPFQRDFLPYGAQRRIRSRGMDEDIDYHDKEYYDKDVYV